MRPSALVLIAALTAATPAGAQSWPRLVTLRHSWSRGTSSYEPFPVPPVVDASDPMLPRPEELLPEPIRLSGSCKDVVIVEWRRTPGNERNTSPTPRAISLIKGYCDEARAAFPRFLDERHVQPTRSLEGFYHRLSVLPAAVEDHGTDPRALNDTAGRFGARMVGGTSIWGYTLEKNRISFLDNGVFGKDHAPRRLFRETLVHELFHAMSVFSGTSKLWGDADEERNAEKFESFATRTPVRSMFSFALREGMIAENPFDEPKYRKLKMREPRPKPDARTFSPDQVDAFLAKADEICAAGYAALFRLTAGSAVRIDEARHCDAGDVRCADGEHWVLTVSPKPGWPSKGYRFRDIPISPRTADAVRAFVRLRSGLALDDKSVWDQMQMVAKAIELDRIGMHDLRRAWASAMHKNGASMKEVSVWLGHASVSTSERYVRVYAGAVEGHEYLPR